MSLVRISQPAAVRNGTWRDYLLAVTPPALITVAAVHELRHEHSGALAWLLTLAIVWPLLWRRRAPLTVFGVCLAVGVLLWAHHMPTVASLALLVALYAVAAQCATRYALAATVLLEVGVVLVAARFAPHGSVDDATLFLSGLVGAALFLGTAVRANRRYLAAAEDRVERLERERDQEALLAAANERARIAREMHDIVAHGLSVVVTLSEGAAANAGDDPASAREAMEGVAAVARQSLGEVRKVLDVLGPETPKDREPQPSLARLPALLDEVRATGLEVQVARSGDPGAMGPGVEATLYRVIQESLTNVIKHAGNASTVEIELGFDPRTVRFEIQDNGHPDGLLHGPRQGGGRGLAGMRERVAAFDGAIDAGPTPAGWLVRGQLKLR